MAWTIECSQLLFTLLGGSERVLHILAMLDLAKETVFKASTFRSTENNYTRYETKSDLLFLPRYT